MFLSFACSFGCLGLGFGSWCGSLSFLGLGFGSWFFLKVGGDVTYEVGGDVGFWEVGKEGESHGD